MTTCRATCVGGNGLSIADKWFQVSIVLSSFSVHVSVVLVGWFCCQSSVSPHGM